MLSIVKFVTGLLSAAPVLAAPSTPNSASELMAHKFVSRDAPGYALSISSPKNLGIDKVNQTSGYLHTPSGDDLFYFFFESRGNPSKDPVLVWLNGGPGCSSLQAILFENGPANMQNGQLTNNTWSWNNNANVLYIDNPAQVGFSMGKKVSTTKEAAEDFKNAMVVFYEKYPQFKDNGLYLAGESYAGRYIPMFAQAVNEYPNSPVKVKSIMIGNGLVDPVSEYESYYPMLCGEGGYPAKLGSYQCNVIKASTGKCVSMMKGCMNGNNFDCGAVGLTCGIISHQFSGLNPYDIRSQGCDDSSTSLCYPGLDDIEKYFNRPEVQSALGVPANTEYHICKNEINSDFYKTRDPFSPTFRVVGELLDQGVEVLAFNGDADIILNWVGGSQWTRNLQWQGKSQFQAAGQSPSSWKPKAEEATAGEVTNYGPLTFLRVHNAGHMVPHDQPEVAHYMVKSWLSGDRAFKSQY